MSNAVEEFTLIRLSGLINKTESLRDKALLLEKEIGLEPFYAMIAIGKPLEQLADSVGVTKKELEYMLQRTSIHRTQYMNATAMALGNKSAKALNHFSSMSYMDKGESMASKHHFNIFSQAIKVANNNTGSNSSQVVINNNVIVRGDNEIPELPNELKDVIEVDDYVELGT